MIRKFMYCMSVTTVCLIASLALADEQQGTVYCYGETACMIAGGTPPECGGPFCTPNPNYSNVALCGCEAAPNGVSCTCVAYYWVPPDLGK